MVCRSLIRVAIKPAIGEMKFVRFWRFNWCQLKKCEFIRKGGNKRQLTLCVYLLICSVSLAIERTRWESGFDCDKHKVEFFHRNESDQQVRQLKMVDTLAQQHKLENQ